MSVYIPGIEMPKNCNECRKVFGCLESGGDGTEWCRLAKGYVGDERTVCPLIPVPDHGRLIDADAFKKRMMQGAIDAREDALTDEIWLRILDAAKSLCLDIDEQPTIIPAEEGQ